MLVYPIVDSMSRELDRCGLTRSGFSVKMSRLGGQGDYYRPSRAIFSPGSDVSVAGNPSESPTEAADMPDGWPFARRLEFVIGDCGKLVENSFPASPPAGNPLGIYAIAVP